MFESERKQKQRRRSTNYPLEFKLRLAQQACDESVSVAQPASGQPRFFEVATKNIAAVVQSCLQERQAISTANDLSAWRALEQF